MGEKNHSDFLRKMLLQKNKYNLSIGKNYILILLCIVVSRNKVASINFEDLLQYMKKLNKRKICWIIREIEKGKLSIYQISKATEG